MDVKDLRGKVDEDLIMEGGGETAGLYGGAD